MNDADFWQRCADANCVVLPVRAFRKWGPMRGEGFIGLMFAAVEFDGEAAGPEFYFGLEQHVAGFDKLHPTPEAALQAYIATKDQTARVDLAAATRALSSADWKPEGAVVSGGGQRFVALTNDGGKTWTPLRAIPDDVAPDTRSDKEAS